MSSGAVLIAPVRSLVRTPWLTGRAVGGPGTV